MHDVNLICTINDIIVSSIGRKILYTKYTKNKELYVVLCTITMYYYYVLLVVLRTTSYA